MLWINADLYVDIFLYIPLFGNVLARPDDVFLYLN